jgi:hypothetical protein
MKALTVLAAALVAGSLITLCAAEDKGPGYAIIHFGPLLPSGDTSAFAEGGLCFGLDVEMPINKGLSFRLVTDYNFFGTKDMGYAESWLAQLGLGLDLQLYLNDTKSLYFIAGPGLYLNRHDIDGPRGNISSVAEFSAGFNFGVGISFSPNFGLEAKYSSGDFPSAQVSAVLRFALR